MRKTILLVSWVKILRIIFLYAIISEEREKKMNYLAPHMHFFALWSLSFCIIFMVAMENETGLWYDNI